MGDNNRVSFLWHASELLSPNQHVNRLLKSYYLTMVKRIIGDKLISDSNQFGNKKMCSKCSAPWSDGNFAMKLVPSEVKGTGAQRLVDAFNKGQKLSKKQKNRAKWYRKKIQSSMVITCNLCQHKTSLYLDKPQNTKAAKKTQIKDYEILIKSKSKKKKKDKTAGLKLKHIKRYEKEKPITSLSTKKSVAETTEVNEKGIKLLNTSINIKKAKNSNKTLASKKNLNVTSKTQQKNTLLQLANLLKSSSKSQNTGGNDRLKNLLR